MAGLWFSHIHFFPLPQSRNHVATTMKTQLLTFCTVTATLLFPISAQAASLLANSVKDFNPPPGNNGWLYGYYDNQDNFIEQKQGSWGSFSATGGKLKGNNTPNSIVRRWVSDFEGEISLDFTIDPANPNSGITDFTRQILVDGKRQIKEDSGSLMTGFSQYKEGRIDVEVGSIIDFVFTPEDKKWSGEFGMTAKINAHPGLVFIEYVAGSNYFTHLGLLFDNIVYEASPTTGEVQATPLDKFISNNAGTMLPHQTIALPEILAGNMVKHIETKFGESVVPQLLPTVSDFVCINKSCLPHNPTFTNVGLIEWAAEQSGLRGGQGFVNSQYELAGGICLISTNRNCNSFEKFSDLLINQFYYWIEYETQKFLEGRIKNADFIITDPIGNSTFFSSKEDFFADISNNHYSSLLISNSNSSNTVLLPELSSGQPLAQSPVIVPTHFLETQVFQQTYNAEITPLASDKATHVLDSSSSIYCKKESQTTSTTKTDSSSDRVLGFYIDNRLDGEYKVKIIPHNKNAEVIIDGQYYNSSFNCKKDVPEPSSVIGVLMTIFLGGWLRKKSRVGE